MRISDWSSDVCSSDLALWSGPAGAKRQTWASLPGQPIFAFAGIHRQGEDWPSFALLSTDPNDLLDRHGCAAMPVILQPEDRECWLTAEWRDAARLVTDRKSTRLNSSHECATRMQNAA